MNGIKVTYTYNNREYSDTNGITLTYSNKGNKTDLANLSYHEMENYLGSIVLIMNPLIFAEVVKDDSSSEIEFGEYPQTEASEEISKKLESIHNTLTVSSPEKIKPTNERYTAYMGIIKEIPVLTNTSYTHDFVNSSFKACKVFLYNGEKYLRYKNNKNGDIKWFKVEPLKWKVNREKNELISVNSFVCGVLENYWYDASSWAHGLGYIRDVRKSEEKTNKFLNDVVLRDILQTVSIKKTIKYQSFEELKTIIKDNKYFECFHDLGTLEFEGPSLSTSQKESINSMLGGKVKKTFKEQKKEENKFSKFRLIKTKEKAENNKEVEKRYKDVLNKLNDLKNAIATLEMEKGNASKLLNGLLSSIIVPEELLIVRVGDHREFNPEFVSLLKFIDLSLVDCNNLKLSGHDLSETNIRFDPQTIYKKDLSYSKLADHNINWSSLKDVILIGTDIEDEKESYDIELAIIDDNTKLPKKNGKAL